MLLLNNYAMKVNGWIIQKVDRMADLTGWLAGSR
jgi:hypothetical protein